MSKELAEIDIDAEDELIAKLRMLQSLRRFCIKAQMRSNNSLEHLLASAMGYKTDLPEDARKALMTAARSMRMQFETAAMNGDALDDDPRVPPTVYGMILVNYLARHKWDEQRDRIEADMIDAARLLPVWPWVRSVLGIAELGLAVLVGEAGDIGDYSGPGKLWKRYGLACWDGTKQSFVPAEITGEERKQAWLARGYNPQRRAEVYAFLDDTMLRAQWRGDRDETGAAVRGTDKPVATPAHALGPYGEVYGERKAWNVIRGLEPGHADKEARRFMAKRFIRDLWCAWQDARIARLPVVEAAAELV